jgi:GT2 family glycosyltransferase
VSVDVVIVAHDHAATLPATLAGLAGQSAAANRVVVVDNASTDGSREATRRFADRLPLELIESADNLGFAAAANRAIRRCDAPWLLSLNPDCRLVPDFLATLAGAADRDGTVGSASGLLLRARGDQLAATEVVDSAGMVVTAGGRHLDRGAGARLTADLERPARVFGASGAAALYRRLALDDVAYAGGEVFDETFFAYREDADLAWRLQRRGWSCLYWPAARAWHARGLKPEARRRGTEVINRHSVRNRFLLRWSNADWRWLLACFPWWLARDLLVVAACLTVERSSLPALAEAFALRRQQRARGRANAAAAGVSGWRLTRWFLPGGRVRALESS